MQQEGNLEEAYEVLWHVFLRYSDMFTKDRREKRMSICSWRRFLIDIGVIDELCQGPVEFRFNGGKTRGRVYSEGNLMHVNETGENLMFHSSQGRRLHVSPAVKNSTQIHHYLTQKGKSAFYGPKVQDFDDLSVKKVDRSLPLPLLHQKLLTQRDADLLYYKNLHQIFELEKFDAEKKVCSRKFFDFLMQLDTPSRDCEQIFIKNKDTNNKKCIKKTNLMNFTGFVYGAFELAARTFHAPSIKNSFHLWIVKLMLPLLEALPQSPMERRMKASVLLLRDENLLSTLISPVLPRLHVVFSRFARLHKEYLSHQEFLEFFDEFGLENLTKFPRKTTMSIYESASKFDAVGEETLRMDFSNFILSLFAVSLSLPPSAINSESQKHQKINFLHQFITLLDYLNESSLGRRLVRTLKKETPHEKLFPLSPNALIEAGTHFKKYSALIDSCSP